jgi:acyl carrier protein
MSVQQLKSDIPTTRSEPDLSDLYAIVSSVFEVPRARLKPDTSFVEDLAADSLDIIELATVMEERFDVTVPDEAPEQLKTIRDLADLLAQIR